MTSWLLRSAFAAALSPLLLLACTSNSAKPNSPRCPTAAPAATDGCSRGDVDGGALSCTYACSGNPGWMTLACSPNSYPGGWSVSSADCVAITPAAPVASIVATSKPAGATGPIPCGNTTCSDDEYCAHECCDETPCTRERAYEDAGPCPVGSHAVPDDGGECAGGCIDDHPECLPSYTCEKGSPPSDCVGDSRSCSFDCGG